MLTDAGDFIWGAKAPRRNCRQRTRTLLIGQRTRHVRFNKARSNNVYSNTAGRNFTRQ